MALDEKTGAALIGGSLTKKGATVKIEILVPCWIGGKPRKKGDLVDAKESDARVVIGMKKAKLYEPATKGGEDKKAKGGDLK